MNTLELTKEQIEKLANGEDVEIEYQVKRTENIYQTMRTTLSKKLERWEPQDGYYLVDHEGEAIDTLPSTSSTNFGLVYKTMEAAEKARDKMRKHNRLLAYVDESDPTLDLKFKDYGENYYICYGHKTKTYSSVFSQIYEVMGAVYMSKEVAEELCRKLNSGEVVL